MENITVHAKFHAAHRQLGYPGECRFVHGHTWRGTISITTDEFPRDEIDMSLDFGDLKDILRKFDHRLIVTADDPEFSNPALFEAEGVIVIQGRGPSVENIAVHAVDEIAAHIRSKFPDRKQTYQIAVTIIETENNTFTVTRDVTV
jgi:6-pyruvoyltetrahydropterin/6-carboxytetrahydropterin synthase